MLRKHSGQCSFFLILVFACVFSLSVPAFAGRQTADFKADHPIGVSPLTVQFNSAFDDGACSHEWDFGDGERSDLPNPRHTYTFAGAFTVRHTVKSPAARQTEIRMCFARISSVRRS